MLGVPRDLVHIMVFYVIWDVFQGEIRVIRGVCISRGVYITPWETHLPEAFCPQHWTRFPLRRSPKKAEVGKEQFATVYSK